MGLSILQFNLASNALYSYFEIFNKVKIEIKGRVLTKKIEFFINV